MGKRTSTGRRAALGRAAERSAGGPPSHLVVFREVGESHNMDTLVKHVRGISRRRETRSHNTVSLMSAGDAPVGEMYHDLGIAAVDLTEDQRRELEKKQDEVERVVPNEVRSIPVDPDLIRRDSPGAPSSPSLPRIPATRFYGLTGTPALTPVGASIGTGAPEALIAYLRGYRDAIVGLTAQIEASLAPPSGSGPLMIPAGFDALTWGLTMIGFSATLRPLTGKGIKVAVLDTGVDLAHPDLAARLTDAARIKSFVPGEDASDHIGHGTHVAGTVVGPLGTAPQYGAAPDCDLHVAKVLGNSGSGFDSDILNAIQWALDQGVRVINLSLGGKRAADEPPSIAYERVAQRLLTRSDGALLVAAAGNDSRRDLGRVAPVSNPAACPSILAVAAVDANDGVAWFSNGQIDVDGTVDIAGPGVEVYSCVPAGKYGMKSGTSMATPHVTGVAALLFERNPKATPRDIWAALKSSARHLEASASDVGAGALRLA